MRPPRAGVGLLVAVGCLTATLLAGSQSAGFSDGSAAAPAPPPDGRWQYQLEASGSRSDDATGRIDVDICARPPGESFCVQPRVFDFDLYRDRRATDVDRKLNVAGVDAVHAAGGYAICYVDAGSIESYRPDFGRFRRWHRRHHGSLLGKPFSKRFPDERWANIGGAKQRRFLLRMMDRRTSKCARAGFDAVEYDVVAAQESGKRVTGWKIGYRDQLVYNRGLARSGHAHGLAVGLKNDLSQVRDLVGAFDFAINEECFGYDECRLLRPFVKAGKSVFHVEYEIAPAKFCRKTERLGFDSIKKSADFSLRPRPYRPCS